MDEENFLGGSNYITTARLQTLRVVSPTRMVLTETTSEIGGCTIVTSIIFDFVRDDPNVRCGKIIEVEPDRQKTPIPPTVEPPLPPPPPVASNYSVGLAIINNDCDAQAKEALPGFLKAGDSADVRLNAAQDGSLSIETQAGSYLLALGPAFKYMTTRDYSFQTRLGMYGLEQPLDETYDLSLSLMQLTAEQFSGSWQVSSKDGQQSCTGSVDLLAPK